MVARSFSERKMQLEVRHCGGLSLGLHEFYDSKISLGFRGILLEGRKILFQWRRRIPNPLIYQSYRCRICLNPHLVSLRFRCVCVYRKRAHVRSTNSKRLTRKARCFHQRWRKCLCC